MDSGDTNRCVGCTVEGKQAYLIPYLPALSENKTHDRPNVEVIKKNIQETIHSMEMSYGTTGSLFRSGSRQTFFAAQVVRYIGDKFKMKIKKIL